jgi:hypothetical protein
MAEATCLVLIDGQMLVKQQQLAERSYLALSIERSLVHLAEHISLNPVEALYNILNFPIERGRHLTPKVIR